VVQPTIVHARAVLNAEARHRSHTARARSVAADIITGIGLGSTDNIAKRNA
jgi:hypothetical protein